MAEGTKGDDKLRALLIPTHPPAYGQDFLADAIANHCGLHKVKSSELSRASEVSSLLVSQNPELPDDSTFIHTVSPSVAVVVHLHCQYHYYSIEHREKLKRSLDRAQYGITPARFQTRDLSDRFPSVKWRNVYNGVNPRSYYPSDKGERRRWRKAHGIPEDHILITFVGRLERAKGLDILEKFCALLSHDHLHLSIQFLDNEDYRREAARLQQFNRARIHLLPDTDLTSDRPVRHCDVLLTPSLSEVCPLVVLEAFHCGLNIVGTKSTPFYEELEGLGIPSETYRFLDLPADVDVRRPRKELGVSSSTAMTIAQNLMDLAKTLPAPDDDQRQARSRIITRSPLTQEYMLREVDKVYAEAVASMSVPGGGN